MSCIPTPANNNQLWQEKYRPRALSDYINLATYKHIIDEWWAPFNNYNKAVTKYKAAILANIKGKGKGKGKGKTRAPPSPPVKMAKRPFLVLYGEPGTGKTTLAHCIFADLNYDVIEINSSDSRNKKILSEIIDTSKRSVVYTDDEDNCKELGLIMDELDGLTDGEAGGASTLVELTIIRELSPSNQPQADPHPNPNPGMNDLQVRYPVICTTNSIKEKKLKQILDLGYLVCINQPDVNNLYTLAKQINIAESLQLSDDDLNKLACSVPRDYRKLIDVLYQIHNSPVANHHDELHKILTTLSTAQTTLNQLAPYTNLPIQDIVNKLVCHIPITHIHIINSQTQTLSQPLTLTQFNNELETFFYTDSQLFYINLIDNYPGILEQLFSAPFNSGAITTYTATTATTTATPIPSKYSLFLVIMDMMTQNYLSTDVYNMWEKTHTDGGDTILGKKQVFQDYNVLLALYANFKLLNTINTTYLQTPLTHINTVYHSKYNNKKTDVGYYNNNMINFIAKPPGCKLNIINDIFSGDIELLLLAKKQNIYSGLKAFNIGNTRHTTNLIKKIKNSMTVFL